MLFEFIYRAYEIYKKNTETRLFLLENYNSKEVINEIPAENLDKEIEL